MSQENNSQNLRKYFKDRLNYYKDEIIKDIGRLVAVPSIRDEHSINKNMPFGKEIRRAFDVIKEIAEDFSLSWEDFQGYALHIDYGEGSKTLGILTHTDVVPAGEPEKWLSNPFTLDLREGILYGRGVNDDKASIIGILYIMRILKEAGYSPSKKIRLIVGGAEETTWECMNYYLSKNTPPDIAFSPDCDFPVVNCEKGILRGELQKNIILAKSSLYNLISIQSNKSHDFTLNNLVVKIETTDFKTIETYGKSASKISFDGNVATLEYSSIKNLSRNPHKANHAAYGFYKDFSQLSNINDSFRGVLNVIGEWFPEKPFGEALGICRSHEETGDLTMALCYITYAENSVAFGFDIRYPAGIEEEFILNRLDEKAQAQEFKVQIIQRRARLYMPSDSHLVTKLMDSYKAVMGEEAAPVTKGGASYSRAIPNCVGFGPTFSGETPNAHKENECIKVESLFKALEIYIEALLRL